MAQGFFRAVFGILLTVGLLTTTIINCWQFDRMEQKQIELIARFEEIQRSIDNGLVTTGNQVNTRSGGIHGRSFPDYMVQGLREPGNMIEEDPNPWLPQDAVQGGTLNIQFGSDPKGLNFLTENGADVSEIQAYTSIGLVARHHEDDSKWAPELAYYMAEDIHSEPALAYDGESQNVAISYTSTVASASSTIAISNSDGAVIRTMDGGLLEAGEGSLSWDGRDDAGETVAQGFYTVVITGNDESGATTDVAADIDIPVTYTYRLREDFFWHEPVVDWNSGNFEWLRGDHQVTANDVIFMIDMTMNEQVGGAAPLRSYFENLVTWEATGDFAFKVVFSKRTYAQMDMVRGFFPVPEFLYAHDEDGNRYEDTFIGARFNDHWYDPNAIGAGPYRFVEFRAGEFIKLERDPRFPLGGNAHETIMIQILGDQNQRARKLRTGELHIASLQPSQYRSEFLEADETSPFRDGTLEGGEYWTHTYSYIGWNADKPWFGDSRVRNAMSMAFDADRILNEVFLGLGERCTGPIPTFLPFYNDELPPIPFDLDAASALLDEAGWLLGDDGIREKDGVKFEFSLMIYGSSDEYRILGTMFKEDLARIGVNMSVSPMEWSNLLKQIEDRDYDAVTLAWVSGPDVDFYQIWHSSQADVPAGSNRVGFRNAEADELIVALQEEFDYDERIRLSHEFHELLYQEQPYTFFYTRQQKVFWQTELENVRFSRTRPYMNPRAWYVAQ
jgi:peptide/nickel transport system substrate-binding protein